MPSSGYGSRYLSNKDDSVYRVLRHINHDRGPRRDGRMSGSFTEYEDIDTGDHYDCPLNAMRFELVEDANETTPNY